VILPYKQSKGNPLNEDQLEYNARLASEPVQVERFFGPWRILFDMIHGK
jgi:hypothetical protein